MTAAYGKPPILEAVIDIQLAGGMSDGRFEKVAAKLAGYYELEETLHTARVTIGPSGNVASELEHAGRKFTASDGAEVAILKPQGLTVARLAPYQDWENLEERFLRDWKVWKSGFQSAKTGRLGVRYINRIDIPCGDNGGVRVEDYFKVSIATPDPDIDFQRFSFQFATPRSDGEFELVLNSATVPAELIDHCSFIFDIDVSARTVLGVQNTMVETLQRLRVEKNATFEGYLTDSAKRLFSLS